MCTSMRIISKTNDVFWGRTMDWTQSFFHKDSITGSFPTKIVSIPNNYELKGQSGTWQGKYAITGVGIIGGIGLFDGINEHGLAGDLQVLIECNRDSLENLSKRNLTPLLGEEVVAYILSQCKDVEEVKALAKTIGLVDQKYMLGEVGFQTPCHYSFIDPSGQGVILEPTDQGAFKIYESMGVMTNSPEYFYHTTNIRNYISLDNINRSATKINNKLELEPIENGTAYGLFGLPGDYTSPTRFVRATFISNNIDEFDSLDGIVTLYNCFKTVMIPKGLGRMSQNQAISDYTQYFSGFDLTNRKLYLQDYSALTFTTKQVDPNLKEIIYEDINLAEIVHAL